MQIQFGKRYFEIINDQNTIIKIKKELNNKYKIIVDKLNINTINFTKELEFTKKHFYQASFGFTNKRFMLYLTKIENDTKNIAILINLSSNIFYFVSFTANDKFFNNNILIGEILACKQTNIFTVEDILVSNGESMFNTNYEDRNTQINNILNDYNDTNIFNDLHIISKPFYRINDIIKYYDSFQNSLKEFYNKYDIKIKTNIIRLIPYKLYNLNYELYFIQLYDVYYKNENNFDLINYDLTKKYTFKIKNTDYIDVYDIYSHDENNINNDDKNIGRAYLCNKDISIKIRQKFYNNNDKKHNNYVLGECVYNDKFKKWQPINILS